jgi:hypothetical protein
MTETTGALIQQLLEWLSEKPRTYSEVIEVWRTSCPRLPVWEDACMDGLIIYDPNGDHIVSVSPKGHAFLKSRRRP